MSEHDDALEIVRGSGNVFRDLGHSDAEILQVKAMLASEIIGVLDDRGLTLREAHAATGIAAADFSRIRRMKLERFTIDRLMGILGKLDQRVDVTVSVLPRDRLQPDSPEA